MGAVAVAMIIPMPERRQRQHHYQARIQTGVFKYAKDFSVKTRARQASLDDTRVDIWIS